MSDRGLRAPTGPAGLLQWSIANSGNNPDASRRVPPSAEDRAWFQEAMASQLNVGKRMKEIKFCLDRAGTPEDAPTVEQQQDLLDELHDIVEDIDHARDLRPIGGLPTLLSLLHSEEDGLRARAAAVIGAAAQNNEPVQQWLLDGGALPPLVNQLADSNSTARVSAYTAVSCLVRHNTAGRQALLQGTGLAAVVGGLSNGAPRVQRKAAQLCGALLIDEPDLAPKLATGVAQSLPALLCSGDRQGREAALLLANMLARDAGGLQLLKKMPDLQHSLQRLTMAIEDCPAEEKAAAADEKQLANNLTASLSTTSSPAKGSTPL